MPGSNNWSIIDRGIQDQQQLMATYRSDHCIQHSVCHARKKLVSLPPKKFWFEVYNPTAQHTVVLTQCKFLCFQLENYTTYHVCFQIKTVALPWQGWSAPSCRPCGSPVRSSA
jgi:hypothetical protein